MSTAVGFSVSKKYRPLSNLCLAPVQPRVQLHPVWPIRQERVPCPAETWRALASICKECDNCQRLGIYIVRMTFDRRSTSVSWPSPVEVAGCQEHWPDVPGLEFQTSVVMCAHAANSPGPQSLSSHHKHTSLPLVWGVELSECSLFSSMALWPYSFYVVRLRSGMLVGYKWARANWNSRHIHLKHL